MPIYEYYSPDKNRIYSFFAKTIAQGQRVPKCPDDPKARMVKIVSGFAIGGTRKEPASEGSEAVKANDGVGDARMEAAFSELEREMGSIDENDPRAMARMMRKMAEISGEALDEPMEEAVRKLEEGADPDSLEEQLGDAFGPEDSGADPYGEASPEAPASARAPKEGRAKFKVRRPPPTRDPKLYDYE